MRVTPWLGACLLPAYSAHIDVPLAGACSEPTFLPRGTTKALTFALTFATLKQLLSQLPRFHVSRVCWGTRWPWRRGWRLAARTAPAPTSRRWAYDARDDI